MLPRSCRVPKRSRKTFLATVVFPVLVFAVLLGYTAHMLLVLPTTAIHPSHTRSQLLRTPGNDDGSFNREGKDDTRTEQLEQTCPKRRNLVFLKGMKCATTTLLGMFHRFAYKQNLSVALPVGNLLYHNWPYPMTLRDVRPTSRGEYNMLLHHAIYTPLVMHALMPADTVYISSLRQPFAHFQSVFHYFNIAKIAGVPFTEQDPLIEYLSHAEHYEEVYTSATAQNRWCVPSGFSMTRNLMSHCHGMPLGFPAGTRDISHDTAALDSYIRQLGRNFELVMIVEHLYESLILLRRFLCWGFEDIIFISSNIAKREDHGYKNSSYPRHILEFHKRWSHADYRLYDYFNNTLWAHIARQGSDFKREVKAFRAVQHRVEKYCLTVYARGNRTLTLPAHMEASSEWSRSFFINAEDCWALGPDPYSMTDKMKQQSDELDKSLLKEAAKRVDNREFRGIC